MKYNSKFLLTIVVLTIYTTGLSQSFNWVNQEGGFGYDNASGSCRDLNGNIYIYRQ